MEDLCPLDWLSFAIKPHDPWTLAWIRSILQDHDPDNPRDYCVASSTVNGTVLEHNDPNFWPNPELWEFNDFIEYSLWSSSSALSQLIILLWRKWEDSKKIKIKFLIFAL